MNDLKILAQTRNTYELTIECHLHENHELRERLAERDREVATLTEVLHASVAQLHAHHLRENQQKQLIRRLRDQVINTNKLERPGRAA
jgi:hypothetical protein